MIRIAFDSCVVLGRELGEKIIMDTNSAQPPSESSCARGQYWCPFFGGNRTRSCVQYQVFSHNGDSHGSTSFVKRNGQSVSPERLPVRRTILCRREQHWHLLPTFVQCAQATSAERTLLCHATRGAIRGISAVQTVFPSVCHWRTAFMGRAAASGCRSTPEGTDHG